AKVKPIFLAFELNNSKMKYGFVTLAMLLCTAFGHSQSRTISGTVSDNMGPLPGVNVLVKGTTVGVVSDFDGNFTLDGVSEDDLLVLSYLGFVTQEIPVGQRQHIQVVMVEDTQALDEVIVVGYGTQLKSNVVGSVTSVEVEEATNVPTTNVSEMLRGRAAGVQV